MATTIKGEQKALEKVFCADYDFTIPVYQRPYSWTMDESQLLIEDLYSFYKISEDSDYFLGCIVLIKKDNDPIAIVIDGQQRLTTLTILYSALAYVANDDGIFKRIRTDPDVTNDTPARRYFKLREKDDSFFERYIQTPKGIAELLNNTDCKTSTESQKHIVENAKALINKLNQYFSTKEDVIRFVKFITKHCYLIVVSSPDEDNAFRIFSIMNDRGLNLLPTDIIKARVMGAITKETDQTACSETWESIEDELGRDAFNDLFSHIRMIYAKCKAQESIQKEFNKYVLNDLNNDKAKKFVNDTLSDYSDAYRIVKNCSYKTSEGAEKINKILSWLNMIDNSDWIPVAIKYMKDCSKNQDNTYLFFKKLERLATCMRMLSYSINQRIERYGKILTELENPNFKISEEIELTKEEKEEFIKELNGDIYTLTGIKKNYIVKRLDSFIKDNGTNYDYDKSVFTIEHVLPQTIDPTSQWAKDWKEQERNKWLNKIANLIPLSRKKNSKAQNYDFCEKKERYFKNSTNGVPAYALTTSVINESSWTPETVEKRQSELIKIFKDEWELN